MDTALRHEYRDQLTRFASPERDDLEVLGLLFLRILAKDILVKSTDPSAAFSAISVLAEKADIDLIRLIDKCVSVYEIPVLDDGFGGSLLCSG